MEWKLSKIWINIIRPFSKINESPPSLLEQKRKEKARIKLFYARSHKTPANLFLIGTG